MKNGAFTSYLHAAAGSMRQQKLADMPVMRLGALIRELEEINRTAPERNKVEFDFCGLVPTELDSWRGVYAELALGFKELDFTHYVGLDTLLSELRSAVGKEFTGYKGGDFVMGENTPVWVANYGQAGNTGIVGVQDNGYSVVLLTAYIKD